MNPLQLRVTRRDWLRAGCAGVIGLPAVFESVAFRDSGSLAAASDDEQADEPASKLHGKLFASGFVYQNDQLMGMAVVAIDPETGAWKRLIHESAHFAVSPDRETIVFSKDGALWNGDADTNANPGKVYSEDGRAVFAPDGRSMLVTTWKPKPDKPDESETTVVRMGLDGTGAVPIAGLAGWDVHDWSADGHSLLAQKQRAAYVVQPDGQKPRQLLHVGDHPRFSPDGKHVVYVEQWKGSIRRIDPDGANDRLFFQCPNLTFALLARYSPDGKHLAVVLLDETLGNDGTPVLDADPKISHARIAIFDSAKAEQRLLKLATQDGWDSYPTGHMEWR